MVSSINSKRMFPIGLHNIFFIGGRGQTHAQYDAIRRLMGFTYIRPAAGKKGWRRRKFTGSKRSYPSPRCSKSISKFADKKVLESGLRDFDDNTGGAQFDVNTIVVQLIDALQAPTKPAHVHLQVLGDGFRAMHGSSIINIGVRLLIETEEEAGDTSFTSLATL